MIISPKKNDKRYEKNGKRSFFRFKRLFDKVEILPFPGKIWKHLIIIGVFVTYEIAVSMSNGVHFSWGYYVPFYVIFFVLFYTYAHICYPAVYAFKSSKILAISILIGCFLLSLASMISINHINRYFLTGELSLRTHYLTLVNGSWRSLMLMVLAAIYWLYFNMLNQKRKEIALLKAQQDMERQALELKIAYENARINPHFLFNTLQYIYREVAHLSPQAEEAISNLSEIMRYALTPMPPDSKVPLSEEIRMVELFIELARQRSGADFYLEYANYLSDMSPYRIPQHMLLTLVENMVKHGALNDPQKRALLMITLEANTLHVVVRNHKHSYAITATGGLGMQNLVSRLDYFYPDQYQIDIRDDMDRYNLLMKINL